MDQRSEYKETYGKCKSTAAILTVVFGIATVLLGYIALPLSAAAYASLLIYENKNKRILSYVLPVFIVFIDFILNWANGYFSEQSFAYVVLGLIIYLCYTKRASKCFCSALLMIGTTFFVLLGILFLGFNVIDSPNVAAFADLLRGVYYSEKEAFISIITSIMTKDELGIYYFAITREYAEKIFHVILCMAPAIIALISFIVSGLTLKMFGVFSKKRIEDDEDEGEGQFKWILIPSNVFAYTFVALAVLNAFANGTDWFSLSIVNLYWIFLPLFAYIGLKFVFFVVSSRRGIAFAVFFIIFLVILIGGVALTLLSLLGVFMTVVANKNKKLGANNTDQI